MRRGAPARGLALTAALALSLTACTGGEEKEPEETASPSTTAPASASQGTGSERPGSEGSESDGAEKSEGTDESTEPSDDQPSDAESPQADGGDSDPSGADGGEYVPASADGPAKNVPKPEMPEEMKEETPEGAKAAVQYWWETLYYLQRTGDAEPMLAVSSNDCNYCARYSEFMSDLYKDGHWHSGSSPKVESTLIATLNKEKRAVAATSLISFGEGIHYLEDGSTKEEDTRESVEDEPWMIDLRFNPDRARWDVTWVSYEGRPNEG